MNSVMEDHTSTSSCTFQLDVSSPGVVKLKDAVKAKLTEFMGSYTDDVLAEYVVVLVGHGKRSAQAVADLEAFLGDQSEAFVTWLWNHLSANESLYAVQRSDSSVAGANTAAGKQKSSKLLEIEPASTSQQPVSRHESREGAAGSLALKVLAQDVMPTGVVKDFSSPKESSVRVKEEPRGRAETTTLPAGQDGQEGSRHHDDDDGEHNHDRSRVSDAKRTRSPKSAWSRRGRDGLGEAPQPKKDPVHSRVRAPRRLLESAVRDAVGPVGVSLGSGNAFSRRAAERTELLALDSSVRDDAIGPGVINGSLSRKTESRCLCVSASSMRRSESRLLESAIRDAVGHVGLPNNSGTWRMESGLKRLRSVVLADTQNPDLVVEAKCPLHQQSKPRLKFSKGPSGALPGAMAVALKAAAAAAEDVNYAASTKPIRVGRTSVSIWDRLGNRTNERLGSQDDNGLVVSRLDAADGSGEAEERSNSREEMEIDGLAEDGSRMVKRQKWRRESERSGRTPREHEEDEDEDEDEMETGGLGVGKRSKWRRSDRLERSPREDEGQDEEVVGSNMGKKPKWRSVSDRLGRVPTGDRDGNEDEIVGSDVGKKPKSRRVADWLVGGPRDHEPQMAVASDVDPGISAGYHLQGSKRQAADNKWRPSGRGGRRTSREEDGQDESAGPSDIGHLHNKRSSGSKWHSCEGERIHYEELHEVTEEEIGDVLTTHGDPLKSVRIGGQVNANGRNHQSKKEADTIALRVTGDVYAQQPTSKSELPFEKQTAGLAPVVDTNDLLEMKKRMRQVQLEMTKLRAKQVEVSKEVLRVGSTPPAPGLKARSQEEIDAHSICVTNIHFGASKEVIAAHFKSCGDIVQVTLVTDGATGKPRGIAYVEFSSKDGVNKALGLNDSSLLSRVLKVVKKDREVDPPVSSKIIAQPSHAPPFVTSRTPPVLGSFLRGTPPSLTRPSSITRPFLGTANLQWKRETWSPNFGGLSNVSTGPPRIGVGRAALRSPTTASLMGGGSSRYGLGPIRVMRSMSYVRPMPYQPRETLPAVQEQKVAN